jgi:hypothetical protein
VVHFATLIITLPVGVREKKESVLMHACMQVWPTVYGGRIAAFHVGKGCKLMYSPNGCLTPSPGLSDESRYPEKEKLKNVTVLLSPLGSLLTVSVPLPCLIRFVYATMHPLTFMQSCNQAWLCTYIIV